MNHYRRISVFEADELLGQHDEAVLLDVRDERAFGDGHHPRALHFNERLMKTLIRKCEKNVPIIIYCYHGNSSRELAQFFTELGFSACYSVDGGYSAWRRPLADKFKAGRKLCKWLQVRGFNCRDINARLDSENTTALMRAAREGASDIVRELIDAGADPNLADIHGNNALWYACLSQSSASVKTLINADIEVDNTNHRGFTALNYAVGMEEISALLVGGISCTAAQSVH